MRDRTLPPRNFGIAMQSSIKIWALRIHLYLTNKWIKKKWASFARHHPFGEQRLRHLFQHASPSNLPTKLPIYHLPSTHPTLTTMVALINKQPHTGIHPNLHALLEDGLNGSMSGGRHTYGRNIRKWIRHGTTFITTDFTEWFPEESLKCP